MYIGLDFIAYSCSISSILSLDISQNDRQVGQQQR
jgi:hypothetical protein